MKKIICWLLGHEFLPFTRYANKCWRCKKMKNTKFELQTFNKRKLHKKEKGFLKTKNFTIPIEKGS